MVNSFQSFFKVLRTPAYKQELEKQFAPAAAGPDADPEQGAFELVNDEESRRKISEATYSERVEGFGEWQVYITDKARGDLKSLRRKSAATLSVVLKKIRYSRPVH